MQYDVMRTKTASSRYSTQENFSNWQLSNAKTHWILSIHSSEAAAKLIIVLDWQDTVMTSSLKYYNIW